jgi:DnaJ-class molecular chaperone
MNARDRRILEKYGKGDKPLNKAIASALAHIKDLEDCPKCNGSGRQWFALYGFANCEVCKGSGKR